MRITEDRLRRLLREEARRTRLFEVGAVEPPPPASPSAPVQTYPSAAPAQAASDANAAAGSANATLAAAAQPKGPDDVLKDDLTDIMYGVEGDADHKSNLAKRPALFHSDLVLDLISGTTASQYDDGDLEDLPEDIQKDIFDQTFNAIKGGTLTAESFYEIVKTNYANTFPNLDPPEKDDAMTRPGTDTFWFAIQGAISKWKRAGGKPGAAAPTAPTAPATPGGGEAATPGGGGAAAAGAGAARGKGVPVVAGVKEIQAAIGMDPKQQDGAWGPTTQQAVRDWAFANVTAGTVKDAAGADVRPIDIATKWATTAATIATVKGAPVNFKPKGTPMNFLQFINAVKGAPAAAPAAPAPARKPPPVSPEIAGAPGATAEGSWRRGSRLVESDRNFKINWGR